MHRSLCRGEDRQAPQPRNATHMSYTRTDEQESEVMQALREVHALDGDGFLAINGLSGEEASALHRTVGCGAPQAELAELVRPALLQRGHLALAGGRGVEEGEEDRAEEEESARLSDSGSTPLSTSALKSFATCAHTDSALSDELSKRFW